MLVATVRALKHHGGDLEGGAAEIEAGAANLARHIGIVNGFGLQAVVGVNKFPTDTAEELELVRRLATEAGAYAAEINTAFEHGGDGATALAEAAVAAADEANSFDFAYALDAPIEEKIRLIATRVYGADGVELLPVAKKKAADWANSDLARLPICMAKTHLSLSHDPALKNAPTGFTVTVRDLRPYTGAGWIVALCGDMMTMPGLGKTPAAYRDRHRRDRARPSGCSKRRCSRSRATSARGPASRGTRPCRSGTPVRSTRSRTGARPWFPRAARPVPRRPRTRSRSPASGYR